MDTKRAYAEGGGCDPAGPASVHNVPGSLKRADSRNTAPLRLHGTPNKRMAFSSQELTQHHKSLNELPPLNAQTVLFIDMAN
ncbi:hypothetical protein NQZ68_004403 [Dissostichus eleginoides]|nr:hypothetical protein NQZ68_004403 [Dissostichus eleginoides]